MTLGSGMRVDSWPPGGGPPGSDLEMMRAQLLDNFDVKAGIMLPLVGALRRTKHRFRRGDGDRDNDGSSRRGCDREPRLKGSVQISLKIQEAAIARSRSARATGALHR